MITIGSDYDGIINPLDAYCYAEDLETLRNILIQKLELQISWNPLLKDKNAAEVIDAIMFKNAVKFLKILFSVHCSLFAELCQKNHRFLKD